MCHISEGGTYEFDGHRAHQAIARFLPAHSSQLRWMTPVVSGSDVRNWVLTEVKSDFASFI